MVPKARKLSLWWQAENGLAPTGRAQLQLATAPQGRTPVLGVSGSGQLWGGAPSNTLNYIGESEGPNFGREAVPERKRGAPNGPPR